ncbi:MAG TPA: hypothetical protein VJV78_02795 [Polyangiales bacterium]|nr:hypothetical protein [Polyangiales bacterium]
MAGVLAGGVVGLACAGVVTLAELPAAPETAGVLGVVVVGVEAVPLGAAGVIVFAA